jgi:hypothetical protein
VPFPVTRDGLVAGGYRFENHARCKSCGQEIEWWRTPNERKMPVNLMQDGHSEVKVHFEDCQETGPLFRGG